MKIVQLSEGAAGPYKFSYLRDGNNNKSGGSAASDDGSSSSGGLLGEHGGGSPPPEWKEDDTCVQLRIPMPGVGPRDIRLSLRDGVLRVWGRRSDLEGSSSSSASGGGGGSGGKRRRLNVREFPVDERMLDVGRAIATVWGDSLVLYAPKRVPPPPQQRQQQPSSSSSSCCHRPFLEELLDSRRNRHRRAKVASSAC